MKLTANNSHPTKLLPGSYRFTEKVLVSRFQGDGDGRREIECWSCREFDVPYSVNHFWFGVELVGSELTDGYQERNILASYLYEVPTNE